MGIYIRNMEMPKKCYECVCYDPEYNECNVLTDCRGNGRYARVIDRDAIPPADCPLVPIPHPHGRLIDADALLKDDSRKYDAHIGMANGQDTTLADSCHRAIQWTIEDAPTIIPAEEESNG